MTIMLPDVLFHGSLTDIKSFRAGSHFGSQRAALAAAAAKFREQSDSEATGFLYKVQLTATPEQVVFLEDWGSPTYVALFGAMYISRQFGIELAALNEVAQIHNEKSDAVAEQFALHLIGVAADQSGKRVICYKNDVEDVDSMSAVILASEGSWLKVESKVVLSAGELRRARISINRF